MEILNLVFLYGSTIVLFIVGLMWSAKDFTNVMVKSILLFLTFIGAILILKSLGII